MWPKRKPSSPAKVRASGLTRPLRTSAWRRPATSPTKSGGERSATAPHQNTCPITAARWSTASSSSPSRSSRAASTACTVSGTRIDSTAASGSSLPSRSTSTPSSTSIRSISSRNSGLPPVARPTASAASGSSGPARFSSSVRTCSRGSGANWIVVPPHAGRSSARSGRAMQQTRIGASRLQPARYSTRSRKAGSAHWMSSSTSTSGRSRASVSSRRRIAQ
jgi:hypothetical protein